VVGGSDANRLLAVADSGRAEFIVTSDISLLQLGRHGETRIVRPR
jgi:predicted nucleic acid-binding protein